MGVFAGKQGEDGSRYVMIWGRLSREVKVEYTKDKGLPNVSFCICYDKGQFMNCYVLGENPVTQMASCLEKGDTALCLGVWRQKNYTNKHGESKLWSELRCDMIVPQTASPIGGPALGDQGEPDVFESQGAEEPDYQPAI